MSYQLVSSWTEIGKYLLKNMACAADTNSEGSRSRPTCLSTDSFKSLPWVTEPYFQQREIWPQMGRHILANYDDSSMVVYQAFNHKIAKFAVEHQRFGGEDFSFSRMSWIKTNFLWMMYRSGWATKRNQERILAVRISRDAFNEILAEAYTTKYQAEQNKQTHEISVRLQWDPDHLPNYDKVERRAIQLGLKGETLRKYGTEWILNITDITPFVQQQYIHVQSKDLQKLVTPRERVYMDIPSETAAAIELDTERIFDACMP